MRKLLLLTFVVALMASPVYADSDEIVNGMGQKAVRGVVNLFTGLFEFPVQICKGFKKGFEPIENEVGSKTVGTVLGVFRGASHAMGRTSWGALELMGFWTANPESNEGVGIPFDAEYSWEEGEQYSIFEPSLEEGVKPIFRKFGHGLADAFIGIAEVPGQTLKGKSEGNIVVGMIRGGWFWFSRSFYGMTNAATFLLPNPPDNPGAPFTEKWPWEALSSELE